MRALTALSFAAACLADVPYVPEPVLNVPRDPPAGSETTPSSPQEVVTVAPTEAPTEAPTAAPTEAPTFPEFVIDGGLPVVQEPASDPLARQMLFALTGKVDSVHGKVSTVTDRFQEILDYLGRVVLSVNDVSRAVERIDRTVIDFRADQNGLTKELTTYVNTLNRSLTESMTGITGSLQEQKLSIDNLTSIITNHTKTMNVTVTCPVMQKPVTNSSSSSSSTPCTENPIVVPTPQPIHPTAVPGQCDPVPTVAAEQKKFRVPIIDKQGKKSFADVNVNVKTVNLGGRELCTELANRVGSLVLKFHKKCNKIMLFFIKGDNRCYSIHTYTVTDSVLKIDISDSKCVKDGAYEKQVKVALSVVGGVVQLNEPQSTSIAGFKPSSFKDRNCGRRSYMYTYLYKDAQSAFESTSRD